MRNSAAVHPTTNQPQPAPQQSSYEWLKSQIPTTPLEVVKLVKEVSEKAVIDLGMMSSAFDSSSEGSNNFMYALYVAGFTIWLATC